MAKKTRRLIPALGALLCLAGGHMALAAECYQTDSTGGVLGFSGVADGSPFSGEFGEFNVTVCLADGGLAGGEIFVEVATGSATIGNSMGDRALKDEELFFVERFPEAVWASEGIVADAGGFLADGQLGLRGVSADQAVRLRLDQNGDSIRIRGGADILRLDYQVGLGEFEDTEFIHNEVALEFDLELGPSDSH